MPVVLFQVRMARLLGLLDVGTEYVVPVVVQLPPVSLQPASQFARLARPVILAAIPVPELTKL